MSQALPLDERHTNTETGSSDRVQASLQSTSNVQIDWLIESDLQVKVEHLAPGPRSLQLPVPYLCGVRRVVMLIHRKLKQCPQTVFLDITFAGDIQSSPNKDLS
jgi:hypothetical protein